MLLIRITVNSRVIESTVQINYISVCCFLPNGSTSKQISIKSTSMGKSATLNTYAGNISMRKVAGSIGMKRVR